MDKMNQTFVTHQHFVVLMRCRTWVALANVIVMVVEQVGGPNVTITSSPDAVSNNASPSFSLDYDVASGNSAQARLLPASDASPGPYVACNDVV